VTERREVILVVEDDSAMRRAIERVVASLAQTEPAGGVEEALTRLRSRRYELALVDVQLPDGDGYALCRQIREISPDTDVILITGSLSEPDEKLYRSLEEGAFYFLFKPFERRVLRALVNRALELQRQRKAKEKYAQELASDLERARRFQQSLMPSALCRRPAGGWRAAFSPVRRWGATFTSPYKTPTGAWPSL
jgi:DNA-binding NtrC family response regulator